MMKHIKNKFKAGSNASLSQRIEKEQCNELVSGIMSDDKVKGIFAKQKKRTVDQEMDSDTERIDMSEISEIKKAKLKMKKNKMNKLKGGFRKLMLQKTEKEASDEMAGGIMYQGKGIVPKGKKRKANKDMDFDMESLDLSSTASGQKKRKKNQINRFIEAWDTQSDADNTQDTEVDNLSNVNITSNEGISKKKQKKKKPHQASAISTPNQSSSSTNDKDAYQITNLGCIGDGTDDTFKDKKANKTKRRRLTKPQRKIFARERAAALSRFNNSTSSEVEESNNVEDGAETDESPKKKKRSGSSDNILKEKEPKKKKKKSKLVSGSCEETNQVENNETEMEFYLSKKELKFLKKKNKKLKGIVSGLDSEEPKLKKFSVKLEEIYDETTSAKTKDEESDDDGSFPQTPISQKFVQKLDSEEKTERTLFVGNLPTTADQKVITEVFKPFGKVESVRLRCAIPPKPSVSQKVANIRHDYHKDATSLKGFIVFEKKEDAEKALSLNGTVFNGHHIRVDKAFGRRQPNTSGKPQHGTPQRETKPQHNNKDSLFLGNLPYKLEDETLWSTFASCGKVKSVRVVRDSTTGIGKGFGFVQFEDATAIEAALALDGTEIDGRQIRVKPSEPPKNRDSGRFQHNKGSAGPTRGGKKFGGFRKFRQNDDSGPRKTFKKFNNSRKKEQEKKKIAAIFTTQKS